MSKPDLFCATVRAEARNVPGRAAGERRLVLAFSRLSDGKAPRRLGFLLAANGWKVVKVIDHKEVSSEDPLAEEPIKAVLKSARESGFAFVVHSDAPQ